MARRTIQAFLPISIALVSTFALTWPGEGVAETTHPCHENVWLWLRQASRDTDLELAPISCLTKGLKVSVTAPDSPPLTVEVLESDGPAFRRVGRFAVAPIIEVADYRMVPEGQRRAFDSFTHWLERHIDIVTYRRAKRVGVMKTELPPTWNIPPWSLAAGWLALPLLWLAVLLVRGRLGLAQLGACKQRISTMVTRLKGWCRSVGLGVVAFCVFVALMLPLALREPAFNTDTIRDLLSVREYLFGARSGTLGSLSSAGFFHGFVWQRVIGLFMDREILLAWFPLSVLVGLAAVSAPLFEILRSRNGTFGAALAFLFYAHLMRSADLFFPLWNPTLVPHCVALLAILAYLCLVPGRGSIALFVAVAVVHSIATQVHLQLFFLAPCVVYVAFKTRERWLALLLYPVVLVLSWATWSADSLAANWGLLWSGRYRQSLTLPVESDTWSTFGPPTIALLVVVGHELWRRRRKIGSDAFARFCQVALVGYVGCVVPMVLAHQHAARYWIPLIPFALFLVADGVAEVAGRLPRRLQWPVISVAAMWLVVSAVGEALSSPKHERLTLRELHDVVYALRDRGLDTMEAYELVTPAPSLATGFFPGVWLHARCMKHVPWSWKPCQTRQRYLLLPVAEGTTVVDGAGRFDVETIPGADRDLLLVEFPAYVAVNRFVVCATGGGGDCYDWGLSFTDEGPGNRCFRFEWALAAQNVLQGERGEVALRFPVEIPSGGETRTVRFPAREGPGQDRIGCGGRVHKVKNVEHRLGPEARMVELIGTDSVQRGYVEVVWDWSNRRCFRKAPIFPLPVIELPSGLEHLVE